MVNGEKEPDVPAQAAAEVPGAEGDQEFFEGPLSRKQEWESSVKKASNRSWGAMYAVLSGKSLAFYKDQKHAKADPTNYFHHEPPLDLEGASCLIASDYTKRAHVFRLRLASQAEFLFQCKDDDEMNAWISKIRSVAGSEAASPARAQTLPASSERKDEPKKRTFFTLGKKK
jgi:spectrin beta